MKHWVYLEDFSGATIDDKKTVHRLTRVLRLKPGDTFLGFDGRRELTLRVKSAGPDSVSVETLGSREAVRIPNVKLTVAQALLKGKRWDIFLEKSAEMGVHDVVPLLTEKSVVKISKDDAAGKVDRWQRILQSAAAQCRGGTVTGIAPPVDFNDFVRASSRRAARFIFSAEGDAAPFADVVRAERPARIILAIGPEGDFTRGEIAAASEAGFTPVTLGPRILRAETAAIVASSLALF